MFHSGVHKHISEELVKSEMGSQKEMQTEDIVQVYAISFSHKSPKEHQEIDDKQVLCYWRHLIHFTI